MLDCHHLTQDDLAKLPDNDAFDCYEFEKGWWLRLSSQQPIQLRERGFSEDFITVWDWALHNLVEYIYFSVDGPVINKLPYHEW